jgi:hypothetical protein
MKINKHSCYVELLETIIYSTMQDPLFHLQIKFGNAELRPGDTQTPTNVKDVPAVTIEQDASEFFTLICHGKISKFDLMTLQRAEEAIIKSFICFISVLS